MEGYTLGMRKKILTLATAAAVALSVTPAVADAQQPNTANVNETTEQINQGIKNAFNPDVASSYPKEEGAKGFFEMAFRPYKNFFKPDNLEQSSQGAAGIIINWLIIAGTVTVVGQIIQLIMANLPR